MDAEVSTQEAASLLNVSLPNLIQILDQGLIPFRMKDSDRRVPIADLLAYKQRDDKERKAIIDELSAEAQRLGLGYGS